MMVLMQSFQDVVCNMDHVVAFQRFMENIYVWKSPVNTVCFLLVQTFAILYYQLVPSIGMILAVVYLLYNRYSHKTFEPWEPDVIENLKVVRENIDQTVKSKLLLDKFRAQIICWGNPEEVNKLMNYLILGAVGSFILLQIVPLHLLLIGGVWSSALINL